MALDKCFFCGKYRTEFPSRESFNKHRESCGVRLKFVVPDQTVIVTEDGCEFDHDPKTSRKEK